jgi:hypothetical protein
MERSVPDGESDAMDGFIQIDRQRLVIAVLYIVIVAGATASTATMCPVASICHISDVVTPRRHLSINCFYSLHKHAVTTQIQYSCYL